MREYIAQTYSRERFLKEMINEKYRPALERGMTDLAFRETKEFKDAFDITVNVAVPMAKMIIGGQRDIYVAQFAEKNPAKVELFALAKTEDEKQYVSWISEEVAVGVDTKLGEGADAYHYMEGDKVFSFNSPEQTWKDLCGRAGFLVVRNGKIAQVIVTFMN